MSTTKVSALNAIRHEVIENPKSVSLDMITQILTNAGYSIKRPSDSFEFDRKPTTGFRLRSMGDYQFLRVNTAFMGRGETDLDIPAVRSIYRNMGLWLEDRKHKRRQP